MYIPLGKHMALVNLPTLPQVMCRCCIDFIIEVPEATGVACVVNLLYKAMEIDHCLLSPSTYHCRAHVQEKC